MAKRGTVRKSIMFVVVHIAITIVPIFKFPCYKYFFAYVNVEHSLSNSEIATINMFITFVNVERTYIYKSVHCIGKIVNDISKFITFVNE